MLWPEHQEIRRKGSEKTISAQFFYHFSSTFPPLDHQFG
jgi:hypothetical protein